MLESVARADLGLPPRKQSKEKAKKPRDFGLLLGDDALDLWASWHHDSLMPYSGGLLDQPEVWYADMAALDHEYAVIRDRLKKGLPAQAVDGEKRPRKQRFEAAFRDTESE